MIIRRLRTPRKVFKLQPGQACNSREPPLLSAELESQNRIYDPVLDDHTRFSMGAKDLCKEQLIGSPGPEFDD
jgi:hypothetical protein